MDPQDARRLRDLRAALKRANESDLLSLQEVALLWGVHKSRFVTVRNQIAAFPDPQPAPKPMGLPANSMVYPARAAIEAMLGYVTRHEDSAKAKAKRTAAILGKSRSVDDTPLHTPNELAVLSRLAAETEAREREQGLYIPAAEVARVAGDVFSLISEFCSTLSKKADPHGDLLPAARTRLDTKARELNLQLHRQMKHLLAPNADADGNRDSADRPGKPRARRVRG